MYIYKIQDSQKKWAFITLFSCHTSFPQHQPHQTPPPTATCSHHHRPQRLTGAKKKRSRKELTKLAGKPGWLERFAKKKQLFFWCPLRNIPLFLVTIFLWFFLKDVFWVFVFSQKIRDLNVHDSKRENHGFFCWIFVGSRSISFQWPMCFFCWGTVYKQKFSPSSSNMSSYLEGDWPGPISNKMMMGWCISCLISQICRFPSGNTISHELISPCVMLDITQALSCENRGRMVVPACPPITGTSAKWQLSPGQ